MAENDFSQTVETASDNVASTAAEHANTDQQQEPTQLATAHEPSESSTQGMLRDAIQKVMAEIQYHEQEAKNHLHQAEALRNDLRESFAFLQEKQAKGQRTEAAGASRIRQVAEHDSTGTAPTTDSAHKNPSARPKKKSAARKTKRG